MYVKMDYKESLRRRGAIYCDWTFSSRHGPNAICSREGVSRLLNDRGMLDYMLHMQNSSLPDKNSNSQYIHIDLRIYS